MRYIILIVVVLIFIISQCDLASSKPTSSSPASNITTTTTTTTTSNDLMSILFNSTGDSDSTIPIIRTKRKGTGGRAGGGRAGGGRAGVGAARGLAGRQGRSGSRSSHSTRVKSSQYLINFTSFISIGLLFNFNRHHQHPFNSV